MEAQTAVEARRAPQRAVKQREVTVAAAAWRRTAKQAAGRKKARKARKDQAEVLQQPPKR
jgi:hypothetical protein